MSQGKLVIPTALEAANILIMGQITLIYSNVLFQLASIPLTTLVGVTGEQGFILALVLVVPPILLINIVSCWASTRATFEEFEQYPNSLFLLDTFLLVLFFFMNNLISFSVTPSEGAHVAAIIADGAGAQAIGSRQLGQTLPPFLYFVSGLVCLLYVAWNNQHAKERCKILPSFCSGANMVAHNRFLIFAAFLQFAVAVYSAISDSVSSEGACLVAWVVVWMWLNTQWLITSPLSVSTQTSAPQLPSVDEQQANKQQEIE
jgi:hypothetical protein